MKKLLSMPSHLCICFITVLLTITIDSYVLLFAIDNLADEVREANKANEQVVMAYEEQQEPEEVIVPVTYEKQEDGDMIYDFGDISDEYYFYIIINEEQGVYDYYFPAMHVDWPIECDSLEDLQSVVMCHIEQAYPNARFVMR